MKKIALVCMLIAVPVFATGCVELGVYSELSIGGGSPMANNDQ